jgi:hypothetical protein
MTWGVAMDIAHAKGDGSPMAFFVALHYDTMVESKS